MNLAGKLARDTAPSGIIKSRQPPPCPLNHCAAVRPDSLGPIERRHVLGGLGLPGLSDRGRSFFYEDENDWPRLTTLNSSSEQLVCKPSNLLIIKQSSNGLQRDALSSLTKGN